MSGYHAYQIFDDWTQLVEVCLEALPRHLTSIADTGQLAEDTPETKQVFERIRSRYEQRPYCSSTADSWLYFSQALAILLKSAEPGLWGAGSYGNFDVGYMGPDVIGHTYQLYAAPNQSRGQIFTPWNVALLLGRLNISSGEQQIHYKPITVGDPAGCGSGVLLLAAAACFPEWAVRLGCVVFQGIDIDVQCVRMAKINCMLYSLNGYYLKFAEALEALTGTATIELPRSHTTACQQAVAVYQNKSPTSVPVTVPTFADLFRQPVEA